MWGPTANGAISMSSMISVICWTRSRPLAACRAGESWSPMSWIDRATISATPSTHQKSGRISVGGLARVFHRAWKRPSGGILPPPTGGRELRLIAAKGLALHRKSQKGSHERNYFGWRLWNAIAPAHARGEQAAAPGVRQANDLLSDFDADAGWHPRDSDHHDATGSAAFCPSSGRRQPVGHIHQVCSSAQA